MDIRLTGLCHCGGVVFSVPVSRDFSAARRRECSFFRCRASVMVSCPQELLKIQQGGDILGLYQWDTHTARHYFCKICGIFTFYYRCTELLVNGINTGCFDDLDLAAFQDVSMADGVSLSLVHR